jgi:hypothetical protein
MADCPRKQARNLNDQYGARCRTCRRWCKFRNSVSDYFFRRSEPESGLVSLVYSSPWSSRAKAFSSWIASLSQFLDSSKNVAFNCGVRAVTAISAQCAACLRHSLGSPTMTSPHSRNATGGSSPIAGVANQIVGGTKSNVDVKSCSNFPRDISPRAAGNRTAAETGSTCNPESSARPIRPAWWRR